LFKKRKRVSKNREGESKLKRKEWAYLPTRLRGDRTKPEETRRLRESNNGDFLKDLKLGKEKEAEVLRFYFSARKPQKGGLKILQSTT